MCEKVNLGLIRFIKTQPEKIASKQCHASKIPKKILNNAKGAMSTGENKNRLQASDSKIKNFLFGIIINYAAKLKVFSGFISQRIDFYGMKKTDLT
ncbi:hypothetical protein FNO01nite_20700 [Flavobacterium noncentrifugens]|nr:hypothetical protein FNO01nite_20700 [Flavobacterium noncentrifugens]